MSNKKGAPENLSPVRTKEEARERGRNGGIASGEARRRKKSMKAAAKMLLDMPAYGHNMNLQLKEIGVAKEDMTVQMAVLVSMYKAAVDGSVRAAEFLRDTAGENNERNRQYNLAKHAQNRADEEFEYRKQKEAGISYEIEDLDDIEGVIYGNNGRQRQQDSPESQPEVPAKEQDNSV